MQRTMKGIGGLQALAMLAAAGLFAAVAPAAQAQATAAPRGGQADQSTSGTAARGQARRGGARGPAFTAHSPRDDGKFTNSRFEGIDPKLPTLVIVGDSTAQTGGATARGWGAVLCDYIDTAKLNLINRSVGGRSYRTFVEENTVRGGNGPKVTMWDQVLAGIKPGDYVLLQMGINDGPSEKAAGDAKRRADLPGLGEEMVGAARNDGTTETIHTYGWYIRKFVKDVQDKGANPIVMSVVNQNSWGDDGKIVLGHGRIYGWAKQSAEDLKVPFLDFSAASAVALDKLGPEGVKPLYNPDRTHLTTEGAIVMCEGFVAGLKGLDIKPLVDALNDKGKAIETWKPAAK